MMSHIMLQGPYILDPRDRIFYALKNCFRLAFELKLHFIYELYLEPEIIYFSFRKIWFPKD